MRYTRIGIQFHIHCILGSARLTPVLLINLVRNEGPSVNGIRIIAFHRSLTIVAALCILFIRNGSTFARSDSVSMRAGHVQRGSSEECDKQLGKGEYSNQRYTPCAKKG